MPCRTWSEGGRPVDGFPFCVCQVQERVFLTTEARQVDILPKQLLCVLLGTRRASSQGGRGAWHSCHLFKNRPFFDTCITLST